MCDEGSTKDLCLIVAFRFAQCETRIRQKILSEIICFLTHETNKLHNRKIYNSNNLKFSKRKMHWQMKKQIYIKMKYRNLTRKPLTELKSQIKKNAQKCISTLS